MGWTFWARAVSGSARAMVVMAAIPIPACRVRLVADMSPPFVQAFDGTKPFRSARWPEHLEAECKSLACGCKEERYSAAAALVPPNPKFADACHESDCELRVQRGTRIIELLVSL